MTIEVSITSKVDPEKWDEHLKRSEFGTIYQSTLYASYLSKVQGRKPFFIQLLLNGKTVAMVLLLQSSQVFYSRAYNPFTSQIFRLLSKAKPFYQSFYGPVLFTKDPSALEALLRYLRHTLVRRSAKASFTPHPLCDKPDPFLERGFRATPLMTCIIDLRQEFGILKKNMDKKSALKNAERAIERGVHVYEATRLEDLETYYSLLSDSRKRLGFRPYSRSEFLPGLEMIQKGSMKCFIAAIGEKPLAGILISFFNGYLNEWGAAQTLEDISRPFYGNDLLRYHVIEWGHDAGYRYYDQSGISARSSAKDLGIFRFKTKWGGEIVNYNSYSIGPA